MGLCDVLRRDVQPIDPRASADHRCHRGGGSAGGEGDARAPLGEWRQACGRHDEATQRTQAELGGPRICTLQRGLAWGMDNWIHNANYEGEFRILGDEVGFRRAPAEGQWGLSMDSRLSPLA